MFGDGPPQLRCARYAYGLRKSKKKSTVRVIVGIREPAGKWDVIWGAPAGQALSLLLVARKIPSDRSGSFTARRGRGPTSDATVAIAS